MKLLSIFIILNYLAIMAVFSGVFVILSLDHLQFLHVFC